MTADLSDINDDMTEDGRSFRFHMNPSQFTKPDSSDSAGSLISWLGRAAAKRLSYILKVVIIISSFVTPIVFIILPRLKLSPDWQLNECGLECEDLLIGISFKLVVLILGYWGMYVTRSRRHNQLPRIHQLKALLVFVLILVTFSYWLFYSVRIIETNVADYYKILQFTSSYVEVLLFLFVICVLLLELRQLQPSFVVRVMRSPDGEQREYDLGAMSIQHAALCILENYYRDFKAYNPWFENAQRKRVMQLEQMNCSKKRSNLR